METMPGFLLGGRVPFAQPRAGYRTGIEPVLLAASVPARPGERMLEAGTGAGAALACLAHRVPDLCGVGIEQDEALATLARENLAGTAMQIIACDVLTCPVGAPVDHAFANPPWHGERSTASPDAMRDAAKRATAGLITQWARTLGRWLRPRGTLTMILPAAQLSEATAALVASGCGSVTILPLWPRAGVSAKLMIVGGILGGRGGGGVRAGLVLHEADGRFTPAAQAVLREGQALHLWRDAST